MRRLLAFLLCAAMCAVPALPAAAAGDDGARWLDVPFVRQQRQGCGAAALAMVLAYWEGRDPAAARAHAQQIYGELHNPRAGGILASDMERYLRGRGWRAFAFHGEWQDLEQHIAQGRPLIVALKPGRRAPLHYVVVAGLDAERGLVLLNDPAQRRLLQVERHSFERSWEAGGRWTLLAVPPRGD